MSTVHDRQLIARARGYNFPGGIQPFISSFQRQQLTSFVGLNDNNTFRDIQFRYRGSRNANLGSGEHIFQLQLTNGALDITRMIRLVDSLTQVFNSMVSWVVIIEHLTVSDLVFVQFSDGERSVTLPRIRIDAWSPRTLFDAILKTLQSDEFFVLANGSFIIGWARATQLSGYFEGCYDFYEFAKHKKSIISIPPDVTNCFFQCLTLHVLKGNGPTRYKYCTKHRKGLQRETEQRFPGKTTVSLASIGRWELRVGFRITIYAFQTLRLVYKGNPTLLNTCHLLCAQEWGDGHVHYIIPGKEGALWDQSRFCYRCMKAYRNMKHTCISFCTRCKRTECEGKDSTEGSEFHHTCDRCHFQFVNASCYQAHLLKICKQATKCPRCFFIYPKSVKNHRCHERKCKQCGHWAATHEEHYCFQQPTIRDRLKQISDRYIFFDYECAFDGVQHIVAGIVAMYGHDDTVYTFDSTESFLRWIYRKEHKKYTCIAHNGGRYDFHLVKQGLIKARIQTKDVIRGNTLLCMTTKKLGIRFVDSYRFIPVALRRFPKTFGIASLSKGYFPYRFFTVDHLNYEGSMPGLEWFDFDQLPPAEREDALAWHRSYDDQIINLYDLCMAYCTDDVRLLREGCLIFRRQYLEITNQLIDPFGSITIAAVCMKIFRTFDLQDDTIAILHNQRELHYAKEFQAYLAHLKAQGLCETVPSNLHGIDRTKRIAYVYKFCLQNGCIDCYNKFRINPFNGRYLYECDFAFNKKMRTIEHQGYQLIVQRECAWRNEYLSHPTTISLQLPLSIRDGFYGGRTEPFKLYYKCQAGERIQYYDYCSLYPSIMIGTLYGLTPETYQTSRFIDFPVGHPVRITENFGPLHNYFGFISCLIRPPVDLYIPYLPSREFGKLVFDLNEHDGVWTTMEIEYACSLGYQILAIHEILHFKQQSHTLFTSYIQRFLKQKVQASGWKKLNLENAMEADKKSFLDAYVQRFGIHIKYTDIQDYNAGQYAISKLALNNLWGKFAQRAQFDEAFDTFTRGQFETLVHDDSHDVRSVIFHDTDARTVSIRSKSEFILDPATTNIAIAAYVTAHARTRLYDALKIIGNNILYCDTDSVIFIDRGNTNLTTGPFLGDLTSELDADDYITEYTATGPKSYAFRTLKGHEVCKVKGFTLKANSPLTFDTLKHLTHSKDNERIPVPQLQFQIDDHHLIRTKDSNKSTKYFRMTNNKRTRSHDEADYMIDTEPLKRRSPFEADLSD